MNLAIEKSHIFESDFTGQFSWYFEKGGKTLAWRFFAAVDLTLTKLSQQPDLGRVRHFCNPALHGLRSFRIELPFDRLIIFYRSTENSLQVWRLMHGARDLPHRLVEMPH